MITQGTGPSVVKVDTTVVGNTDGAEDTLTTYTTAAGLLSALNQSIEIDVWGTLAANATTKRIRVYFGATVLFDTTALAMNATDWHIHAEVFRLTATTQIAFARFSGSPLVTQTSDTTSPAETLANTLVVKTTGIAGAGFAANDIVQTGFRIKINPGTA